MMLSLLQLNINADNYWDQLINYLSNHDFDIIQLQEIAGVGTRAGNINSKRDIFKQLQKLLEDKYKGELVIAETFTSSPSSYFGNATFYKKTYNCTAKNLLYLHKNTKQFSSESSDFQNQGRAVIDLKLKINGIIISFLNAHLAWGPTADDTSIKLEQGQKLVNYVKELKTPFVLSGDFNVDENSKIVKSLEKISQNLTKRYNITNTLNPTRHRAKHLFPPGLAVDFIFISPEIKIETFQVVTEDLSDHYGLTSTFFI